MISEADAKNNSQILFCFKPVSFKSQSIYYFIIVILFYLFFFWRYTTHVMHINSNLAILVFATE